MHLSLHELSIVPGPVLELTLSHSVRHKGLGVYLPVVDLMILVLNLCTVLVIIQKIDDCIASLEGQLSPFGF